MGAERLVYVGTYTHSGRSRGIYVYRLDATGALTHVHDVPDVADPAFLALAPDGRHLYAVNWLKEYQGRPGGSISAFAVDAASGDLAFLNRQPAGGADPCHLCVDPSGRCVLVANHESGTVAVLPIEPDGRLAAPSDVRQHVGSGPRPAQAGPHAHFVAFDPAGRHLLACDKGTDHVMVYRLDAAAGRLLANDPPSAALHAGAGPRHLAFTPDARFVYVNNEQDSTVSAFAYDAERGALRHLQTASSLPAAGAERNTTSEIALHPSGRFLYVSNRGHDSIAIFALDRATGGMEARGHQPSGGRTPRFFALDPSGAYLLACNQDGDTIVTFRVDAESGQLEPTGAVAEVPSPVCLVFA
jgi:6-phosphogluconolactonase